MYTPRHFEETRTDVLQALMRERPLATLVAMTKRGLDANHIPLLLDDDPKPFGTLRGHVARGNPLWKDVEPGVEVIAVFTGPNAYVTPSWYPSKKLDGRVVPTWNYVVVHAHGRLRVVDDASWLRAHVDELTRTHEVSRAEPWMVSDAPGDYVERLIGGIVGVEIVLSRIEGKWKASQNQQPRNRDGVVEGLRLGDAEAVAMAEIVRKRAPS